MREFVQEELRPLADTFDREKSFPTEQVTTGVIPQSQSLAEKFCWRIINDPPLQVKMMGEMGLMGIEIGKQVRLKSALPVRFETFHQYGGAGKDALSYAIAMEEIRLLFAVGNDKRKSPLCAHP